MKLPVMASHWIGLTATLHALAAPGVGPLMLLAPLFGLAGSILSQLRRVFP